MTTGWDIENHCFRAGCRCSHTHGCEKGWIWGISVVKRIVVLKDKTQDIVTQEYDSVSPCPNCDPDRAELFCDSKERHELMDALQNRSTNKRVQYYKDSERNKTKTL